MPVVKKARGFKSYQAKAGEVERKWYILDATDKSLGRISVPIAMKLMGKDKPTYTPHIDTGDFVIVVNAEKVGLDPRRMEQKTYRKWSGYPGGLRVRTLAEQQKVSASSVVIESVRRMLPKSILGKSMLTKLKVYAGTAHPHTAQKPVAWAPLA